MTQVKQGDTVTVHYKGKLDTGKVFYDSTDGDPLQFIVGNDSTIPGFDQAVTGMQPGESKTFDITAKDAYGPHEEKLVMTIDRKTLPQDLKPKIGDRLRLHRKDGHAMGVSVIDISESRMTIDANHPLAGEDLTFDIQLIEIIEPVSPLT
jgi:peptidylprolyl isomerase